MLRFWAFIQSTINLILSKLKQLFWHVLKHPLGSIFWVVKMYFALMFFSLFVACSFGAFASTCPSGSTESDDGLFCQAPAPSGKLWHSTVTFSPDTKTFSDKEKLLSQMAACTWFLGVSASKTTAGYRECTGGRSYRYKNCNWKTNPPPATGGYCDFTGSWQYSTTNGTDYQDTNNQFYCPPENSSLQMLTTLFKPSSTTGFCRMEKPKPNNCFTQPKFAVANQYHFDPSSQGSGSVCVAADDGEMCPWKEMSGSNGVFQPDTSDKGKCIKEPSRPAPTPDKCTVGANNMKVCKADPNEKCSTNSSGAMSCGDSCGYFNNEFMCFTEPDIQKDPNKPDPKPRPDKNDDISTPEKNINDMTKADFKNVQVGIESRLDGIATDIQNSLKQLEFDGGNANKNSGTTNKLLNSINQNTADTAKALKDLAAPGENVDGIEKPEFEDGNNWESRNFGSVMKENADKLIQLPIMKSIESFFDIGFSGSCPTYSVSVWVFDITIDQFCSSEVQNLFPFIRAVVLLMCSFFAIRIALL